jgi:hypothetical protein
MQKDKFWEKVLKVVVTQWHNYNIDKIGLRLCGKVIVAALENMHYILHFECDNLGGALCSLWSLLRCKVGFMYFVDLWFKTSVAMEGAKLFLTPPLKARSFGECTLHSLLAFVWTQQPSLCPLHLLMYLQDGVLVFCRGESTSTFAWQWRVPNTCWPLHWKL